MYCLKKYNQILRLMRKTLLISILNIIFLFSSLHAEVLQISIKIPDLPNDWRLPSDIELDHLMRPQKNMLFPDYIDIGTIDEDRKYDYVVLVVSKKELKEAAIVYLTTKKKWIMLKSYSTFKNKKVGMTMKIIDSYPTAISYGKLGGNGYLYFWEKETKTFVKIFE